MLVDVCRHRRGSLFALAKASTLKPIDRERATVRRLRVRLRQRLRAFLREQAPRVAAQLARSLDLVQKAGGDAVAIATAAARARAALDELDLQDWRALIQVVGEDLSEMAISGGDAALRQLGLFDDDVQDLMRERAEAWAEDRAAEMVGMRRTADGSLVPNPDAKWRIDEATRDALQGLTEEALEQGMSTDELAERIQDAHAFSDARAEMIARTEMAMADVAGSMEGYRASGLVSGKQWLTAEDDKVSDECNQCGDAGVVRLDDNFPTGVDAPPNHPNCRCAVVPVLTEEMESTT